jgi:hypothetical protein
VLEARCADVEVATGAGSGWGVTVTGDEASRPADDAGASSLAVRSPANPAVFPFARGASWAVEVGTDPRLDLRLDLNAGSADLDLGGATIGRLEVDANAIGDSRVDLSSAAAERLDVTVNAADISILLPTTADLAGEVRGNAASVALCAASDVGLRLVVEENITASDNFEEAGLVRRGDAWESPDYASATVQVQLRIGGGAVSYDLEIGGTCR